MISVYTARFIKGTAAERPTATDFNALSIVRDNPYVYLASDTLALSYWNGSDWASLASGELNVITRTQLLTEAAAIFGIPLDKLRTGAGLVHTATPAANVFGIDVTLNVQILKSEAADGNTKTSIAIFQYVLPESYVDGDPITLRLPTQLKSVTGTGVANNGSDIDAECYLQASGAVGSDLISTAAQTYAAIDTYYNKDFTVIPTGLVRGSLLNFKITARAIENDAGNGTLTTHLSAPRILLGIKG